MTQSPVGGSGGGGPPGLLLAGTRSGAVNRVTLTTEALVTGGSAGSITSGSDIDVTATDDSFITGDAGGLAVTYSSQGGKSVAFGVSLAINEVTSTVTASVAGTTARSIPVTATGSVTVKTTGTPTVKAFTIAGALSVGTGGSTAGTTVSLAGVGAGSGNTVKGSNTASIAYATVQAGGAVTVSANDAATIVADAGGFAISFAKSDQGSFVSVALGLSASVNSITRTVTASIDPSTVTAAGTGGVVVEAIDAASISALSMGGAASSNAGSGAGSSNTIAITQSADITHGTVTATAGPVRVEARDTSTITADAGGVSIAVALKEDPGKVNLAAAIAASVAINDLTNTVAALVDTSTVTAGGDLSVLATSTATIAALTLSGSAAVQKVGNTGGKLALTLAGAGAGSGSSIDDTVTALVIDSSLTAGGAIVVRAQRPSTGDTPTISARAYGVTFALDISDADKANLGIDIGAAVALTAIGQHGGDLVRAAAERSTLTAGGTVTVAAASNPSIQAVAIGVTVGLTVSVTGATAVTLSLGGAVTLNAIGSRVDGHVTDGAVCAGSTGTSCTAGVEVSATQTGSITATVVAANVSGTISKGATVSLAAAVATNTLNSTISATVSGPTTTIDGSSVTVSALADNSVLATTVAVVVAFTVSGTDTKVTLSGAGAVSVNTLTDALSATVDGAAVTAGKAGVLCRPAPARPADR